MNRLITVSQSPAVMSSFSGPTVAIAPISKEKGVFVINGGGVSLRMIGVSPSMFHHRSLAPDLAPSPVHRPNHRWFKRLPQIAGQSALGDTVTAPPPPVPMKPGLGNVAAQTGR